MLDTGGVEAIVLRFGSSKKAPFEVQLAVF